MRRILPGLDSRPGDLAFFLIISSTFVVSSLLSVWAVLGIGHVWRRVVVAVCLSAAAGQTFAVGRDIDSFFPAVPALQAMIMMASLWVVRSNGYRLVRIPKEAGAQPASV
jgi:hypothetical protein